MLYLREVLKAAELEPEELVPGIGDDVKVMSIHYLRFFNFPSFNMLNTKRGRLKSEKKIKKAINNIFIKKNRLKDNGFHPVLCLERSERNGYKNE